MVIRCRDPLAFNLDFMMEISKKGVNPMLGEWVKKYGESTMKGYVISYLQREHDLSWKGKVHLMYLKKGWPFWAMIFAILSVIVSVMTIGIKSNMPMQKSEQSTLIQIDTIHRKFYDTTYVKGALDTMPKTHVVHLHSIKKDQN